MNTAMPSFSFPAKFLTRRTLHGDTEDTLIYYVADKGRRTLAIVNAYGQSLAFWDRFAQLVTDRFSLLILQPRGSVTGSGGVKQAYPVEHHVHDMLSVFDAECLDRVHLLGWCTGPKTVLAFCDRYPRRVASLTLVSGSFIHHTDYKALYTRYESTMSGLCRMLDQRPEIAGQLTEMMKTVLFGPRPADSPNHASRSEEVRLLVQQPFQTPESTIAYARQLLAFWNYDISHSLPEIAVPALFIGGELDDIAHPRLSCEIARSVPGAIFAEVRGGSHYLHYDRPALLADMVDRFICSGYGFGFEHDDVHVERFSQHRSPQLSLHKKDYA